MSERAEDLHVMQECYECGAPEEELSIVSGLDGRAWCGRECREKTRARETKRP